MLTQNMFLGEINDIYYYKLLDMINWEQYNYNDKLDLKLVEHDGTTIDLKVIFEDTEWTPHRHPYLADIKILESSDETMYPLNGIMRLPLITEDNLKFLLFCPTDTKPNREVTKEAKIILNN
jgi:hypothetical protein